MSTAGDFAVSQPFKNFIHDFSVKVCLFFGKFELCNSVISQMAPIIIDELTMFVFSPKYFCSRVVGFCTDPYKVLKPEAYIDRMI